MNNTRSSAVAAVFLVTCIVSPSIAQFPAAIEWNSQEGRAGVTIFGDRTLEFGWSVAGLGDVNADGIDDIGSGGPGVMYPPADCGGIPGFCTDCDATAGAVYVLFGSTGIGGDGDWSLGAPETTVLRIEGLHPNDETDAIAPAGDFNNDGIADFLVGAHSASPGGMTFAGAVYVIYGSPTLGSATSFDLATLDGSNGFAIAGGFPWSGMGRRLAAIGDFNDDGMNDIAVGAHSGDAPGRPNAGQVYILFGGRGVGESGMYVLPDSLTPKHGIIIYGISTGDFAGSTISRAGDVNRDGVNDLVMSATYPVPQPMAQGQAYVVYGGVDAGQHGVFELSNLDGKNGFIVNGPPSPPGSTEETKIGAPAGLGDINADGYDDVSVSVDTTDDWVGVIFGGPSVARDGPLLLENLHGENGFRVIRGDASASTARATSAGDVNADGIDDMYPRVFANNVLFGAPGVGGSGVVDVSLFDGRDGFTFVGGYAGRSYSSAGDVNADGIDDVLVSAEHYEGFCEVGQVRILFGRRMGDGDLDADVDLADFGGFQACYGVPPDGDVPDACHPFDFDKDNDVDLADFEAFQKVVGSLP